MMKKEGGGLQWSEEHNSRFKVTKSAILHLTRRTILDPDAEDRRIPPERPPLILEGKTVWEVECHKYLGIQIDSQLRWKEQAQWVIANATKWILQYRRLTRISTGVGTKLMRQLYLAVVLPKMTYGLDIWYTPPYKPVGFTKNTGSVNILHLQKTQRLASTAITGTLHTATTDLLDAHAGILLMELALLKACHRAIVHAYTVPSTCYDFSYFALFTYVFSLFLEVSHGAAALTHFSLTHSIAILIALPHWCSIYSGQSCRLLFS